VCQGSHSTFKESRSYSFMYKISWAIISSFSLFSFSFFDPLFSHYFSVAVLYFQLFSVKCRLINIIRRCNFISSSPCSISYPFDLSFIFSSLVLDFILNWRSWGTLLHNLRIFKSCIVTGKIRERFVHLFARPLSSGCRGIIAIHRIYHPSLNLQRAFRIQFWHSLIYFWTRQARSVLFDLYLREMPRSDFDLLGIFIERIYINFFLYLFVNLILQFETDLQS